METFQILVARRAHRFPLMETQVANQLLAPPARLLAVEALTLRVLDHPEVPTE
jgi:hypothetical protein